MTKNKIIIGLIFINAVFGILILIGKKPSLEEVKEQLLLTKTIEIDKTPVLEKQKIHYCTIKDEETIKEIITILSNCSLPEEEDKWHTGTSQDVYHLELLDENDKLIATVLIDSLSLKIEAKGYHYELDLDQGDEQTLKNMIERRWDTYNP